MESDLSLIEMAGEDDSLLQQIPTDGDIGSVNNYLSCSPLILRSKRSVDPSRISPINGLKDNEEAEKPSCSSPRDSNNKENINVNKLGVMKFSEMKRRKRGGGYNLRKSLAWDRAFFTEEGVLNPLELSMISGNFSKFNGEGFSVIHEEGRESLSGDSDCISDPADLHALEENLFKKLPASPLNEDRKVDGGLLPEQDLLSRDNVAPASAAKRKVLSAHDVNRSGSKRGGCPRPLASSSKKRPANANTTKAAAKESKLPKIPVSKPDHRSLSTTTKSAILGANRLKRNQIAQPVNVQKSAGLKGSSNNSKSAQNNGKAGPSCRSLSAKPLVQHSRKNVANLPLGNHASSTLKLPLVSKANSGPEFFPDPELPATGMYASNGHDGSSKIAVSRPQHAHFVGGNVQYAQVQTTKPSGLRMPSPSLGFFGQRKTQPCNVPESSISNLRKLGSSNRIHELRPRLAPGKIPKVVNDITTTGNIRVLSSSTGCSVPYAVIPISHENMKLNLGLNNVQKVEVRVQYDPKNSDLINNQQHLPSILEDVEKQFEEHAEPYIIEKTSHKEDTELLLHSGSCDQLNNDKDHDKVADASPKSTEPSGSALENSHFSSQLSPAVQVKGVSGTNDMIKHQHVDDKQYNSSVKNPGVISESHSGDAINYNNWVASIVHDDWLRGMHLVGEQSGEQAELIKPCTCEADQISHEENQRPQTNDGILFEDSRSFENSQKCDGGNSADVTPKVRGSSGSELKSSHGPFQQEYTEQADESAAGVDSMTEKSQVGDAQLQSLDENLLVESNSLCTSAAHNQYLMVVDCVNKQSAEQTELRNPCSVVERFSQDNDGSCLNDYLLLARSTSSEEFQEGNVLESVVYVVPERSDACGSESKSSNVLTRVPPAMQDGGVDVDKMSECPHVEDPLSGSVEIEPSVENHQCLIDSQFRHYSELSGQATLEFDGQATLEFDSSMKMRKDQPACAVTTSNLRAFCSLSEELGLLVQRVKSSPNGSILQGIGVNGLKSNSFQKEAETNFFSKDPHGENQRMETYDGILFEQSRSSEESREYDSGNTADVNIKVRGSSGSELECSHGPPDLKYTEQANKCAVKIDNMTEKSHVEGAQVQSLDGNLLVEICNSNLCTSAVHNQYLMVVDGVKEQSGEHPELRNPCRVAEQVSQDNHGLHLNDYLLLAGGTFSKESEENVIESVVCDGPERSDACGSESESFGVLIQVPPTMQDDDFDVDEMAEHTLVEDAPSGSVETQPSVENQFRHDIKLSGQATSSEYDSSVKMSTDEITDAPTACNFKSFCSLSKELALSVQSSTSYNGLKSNILPKEAEAKISQNSDSPNGDLRHTLDNAMYPTEDKEAVMPLKKSGNDTKQDALVIKPPLNAVPFSDEWLAAIEAAGEDILTMKTGAVQNSPTDKSLPEPGPWSPVKRKNNQGIGPFDCTKFTNCSPSDSH